MSNEFKISILIYCSFLITMLFSLIPHSSDTYSFFMFFNIKLSLQTYTYFFCEHISKMMIFYAFYIAYPRRELLIVFWIETLDLFDFTLIYNETWFRVLNFPVEYNDIKFILIAILIIQTSWKLKPSS